MTMYYNYYKNPVEYSFSIWINSFSESYHQLDERRFFDFVFTLFKHSTTYKNWLKKDFFLKKCIKYKRNMSIDIFEDCYEKMLFLIRFLKYHPSNYHSSIIGIIKNDGEYGSSFNKKTIENNKPKTTRISKEEFESLIKKKVFCVENKND